MSGMIKIMIISFFLVIVSVMGTTTAFAQKRAIVIGISDYKNVTPLKGPVDDARMMNAKLTSLGFASTLFLNGNLSTQLFQINWADFVETVKPGDDVVVYYSGHGVELDGTNYLVPQDVLSADKFKNVTALAKSLVSVRQLMNDLADKQARAVIWIIDACRDNPFDNGSTTSKSLNLQAGLAMNSAPGGTFIFYAAGYGETALAQTTGSGKNSLYTGELVGALSSMAAQPVYEVAVSIRQAVKDKAMPHPQHPAYYDGLEGPWCFADCEKTDVKISLNTGSDQIAVKVAANKELTLPNLTALSPENLAALHDEKTGNAVFLGRASFSKNCDNNDQDDRSPFGCDVLRKLGNGDLKTILNGPFPALTAVNIRKGPPIPNPDGTLTYQCAVGTLGVHDQVKFSSVTVSDPGGDQYFWGTLDRKRLGCDGKPIDDAIAKDPLTSGISDPALLRIVDQLGTDATDKRRAARSQLAEYLGHADQQTLKQLTSDIAQKSYRYQLGVAVAIAEGHVTLPLDSQNDLAGLFATNKDLTLRKVLSSIVK